MIVERIWLEQVNDIEPVCLTCHRVGHSEVVPLRVAPRVIVWLKNQVVFKLIDLNRPPKIARFETGFKDERLVVLEIRLVVGRQDVIIIALAL